MNKKKIRALIMGILIIVLLTISIFVVSKCNSSTKETVTVTFDSNGGSEVESVTLKKGEKLIDVPQSFLLGSSFVGWYVDEEANGQFNYDSAINKDITLHAGFVETKYDVNETKVTSAYNENISKNEKIVFVSDEKLTKDEFLDSIVIEAISGDLPESFDVLISGDEYTLIPLNEYMPGKLYRITVPSWIHFKDQSSDILEYTFRIYKEDVENVELSDKITYLLYSEFVSYKGKDETTDEYKFSLTTDKYNEYKFNVNDIICLGNERKYNAEKSVFVKVVDIENKLNICYVSAVDADIEEVFSVIDVKFSDAIPQDEIINQLDVEEIEKSIYESGAFSKITTLVATLVSESETLNNELNNKEYERLSSTTADFTENAYIIDGSLKNVLKFKFAKDAKITIGIGKGHNPNFDPGYSDNFVALNVTFEYEATIKNKVQVQVEFTLTEYLMITAQGALDYSLSGDKFLYFDYALNIYSQTDIDMSILIRSIEKDEKYRDITAEIESKLKKEENDTNNIVEQLKEMLASDDGDIELFRTNILHIPYNIIPILPIMQVNIDFDFVVKMNFAAGLSTDISILEAVQVGVTGDTRDDEISSYKNDLPGANKYSMELTTCGYLGIKAGFEGGLTVSFCGLSKLGKVGVYVFVGPYVDLYGFARLSLVKDKGDAIATLVGGYYIEIGINLEITLEARSDLFHVKIGTTLFDKKWPLVSFGNKDVLLSIDDSELETVYMVNNGEEVATTSINNLPSLKGNYIDITTGEINVKDIPWSKVKLSFSSNRFNLDEETRMLTYKNSSDPRPAVDECVATYYYIGPYLQFNLSSSQAKSLYNFGRATVYYYNNNVLDKDKIGEVYKVNIYTEIDGERKLFDSLEVVAGSRLNSVNTGIDEVKYANVHWNKNPFTNYITEDTDFIHYGEKRQTYIAFAYYNEATNKWLTEIRACDLGEVPVAPTITNGSKSKFSYWSRESGINNAWDKSSGKGIVATITDNDLFKKGFTDSIVTYGKDVNKELVKFENADYYSIYDSLLNNKNEESGRSWYYSVMSIYVAKYEYDDCTVTLVNKDANGNTIKEEKQVPYLGSLTSYSIYNSSKMKFKGFALEENGEVIYKTISEIGPITKDLVLYLIYEELNYNVVLKYYDDTDRTYKVYKTYQIAGGESLASLDYDGALNSLIKTDGVEYSLSSWRYNNVGSDKYNYLNTDMNVYNDIEITPLYNRKVTITLDPGEGYAPTELTGYYTETLSNYIIYLGKYCVKVEDDEATYELIGWKNSKTGEVVALGDVYCDTPTTFVAVFSKTEKIYTFKAYTEYGVLKNGLDTLEFSGSYSEYKALLDEYENWYPTKVRDDENHCYYEFFYLQEFNLNNGISFNYYKKTVLDKHNIKIDANGGALSSDTNAMYEVEYNSTLDLSKLNATKKDDKCTYVVDSWVDSLGNKYSPNASYTIKQDTTLKAIWKEDVYENYTITYILNDKEISVQNYHQGDLINLLNKPTEANGLAFSGWELYIDDLKIDYTITTMPAKNIVAKGVSYEVYVYYKVDGKVINKEKGSVNDVITVKDNYLKTGYTVTSWTTTDVEVDNNKFTMPEKDVTFIATSTINSYKVTYYHNSQVYKEETVEYGKIVSLINVPTEDNKYFAWKSSDVEFVGGSFTMPAKDVTIDAISSTVQKYIVYFVDGEVYDYSLAIPGETVTLINTPASVNSWYVNNKAVTTVTLENDDIFVYSTNEEKSYVIYFNIDSGFNESDDDYPSITLKAEEKYYLPNFPTLSDNLLETNGWYSLDTEILEDEKGKYIIMPEHNVYINAFAYDKKTGSGYTASTYLIIPGMEEVEFLKYEIASDKYPIYFETPKLKGYEFMYWQDEDGKKYDDYNGVYLADMNGKDQKYSGIYRKVELHIAEFILDGEKVGCEIFYDYREVKFNTKVSLPDGKAFSGWINPYVTINNNSLYLEDGTISDEVTIGMNFVFMGFTYSENDNSNVEIELDEEVLCSFYLNENETIKLITKHFNSNISYTVEAWGFDSDGNLKKYAEVKNILTINDDICTISLPKTSDLVSGDNGPTIFTKIIIKMNVE